MNGRAHRSPEIYAGLPSCARPRLSRRSTSTSSRACWARPTPTGATCIAAHARARAGQRDDLPDGVALQHDDQQGHPEARRAVRRAGGAAGRPSGAGWRRPSRRSSVRAITSAARTPRSRIRRRRTFLYRDRLWQGADLVGLGVASFGHINGVHMQNLDKWETYSAAHRSRRDSTGSRLPPDGRGAHDSRVRAAAQARLGAARVLSREIRRRTCWSGSASRSRRSQTAGYLAAPRGRIALTRDALLRVDVLLPRFFLPQHVGVRYT